MQLQGLHLPVTAEPCGSRHLIATVLGSTHIRQLTIGMYASTTRAAECGDAIMDFDDDCPEPHDFLAQYALLFPYLCSINVYCHCNFDRLQPLAAHAHLLTRLRVLHLRNNIECDYNAVVTQVLYAMLCLHTLRELVLCDFSSLPCHGEVDALCRLSRLTSLEIQGQWLAHLGAEPGFALPPSLEKVALILRIHVADDEGLYLAALQPLFLKTFVMRCGGELTDSLRFVVPGLPNPRHLILPSYSRQG